LLQRIVIELLAIKGRAFRAARAHSEFRSNQAERMPGVPVGASLYARIATKGEGRE
jgi:hypothetical protein